jgi:DNA-binding MarR family transcriptional regulator
MNNPILSPDYALEDQVGFVLRLATQFHTAIFTARMVDSLTQTQFSALATIYQFGPCSQSELSKLLALDTATVNGVVERLTARGFVVSRDDPNDRRRQTIALTPEGAVIGPSAIGAAKEITAGTVARLTPAEEARLLQLLRKMIGRTGAEAVNGDALASLRGQRRKTAKPRPVRMVEKRRLPARNGHGQEETR